MTASTSVELLAARLLSLKSRIEADPDAPLRAKAVTKPTDWCEGTKSAPNIAYVEQDTPVEIPARAPVVWYLRHGNQLTRLCKASRESTARARAALLIERSAATASEAIVKTSKIAVTTALRPWSRFADEVELIPIPDEVPDSLKRYPRRPVYGEDCLLYVRAQCAFAKIVAAQTVFWQHEVDLQALSSDIDALREATGIESTVALRAALLHEEIDSARPTTVAYLVAGEILLGGLFRETRGGERA